MYGWGFAPWLSCAKEVEALPGIFGHAVELCHKVEVLRHRDLRRRSWMAPPDSTKMPRTYWQVTAAVPPSNMRHRRSRPVDISRRAGTGEGLPGRTTKTVEANRDSLRPLLVVIGKIPLKELTVQDVRAALKKMAATHATRTLEKGHNCLTRARRDAEGQDLVR